MRFSIRVALFLALSASAAVSAQTPDPNPPWSYDPIEVGNVRAYTRLGVPEARWRTDSPAAITLDGERWVIRRTQQFQRVTIGPEPAWTLTESRRLVRFDTTAANVAVQGGYGGRDHLYPCRLDLPIPAENPGTCDDSDQPFYTVRTEAPVQIGSDIFSLTVRSFDGVVPGPELAAGVGDVGGPTEGSGPVRLDYAVVGGDSLASRPEEYPVTDIDPTPGWQYYPLAVGNEWEYTYGRLGIPEGYRRRRVVGTVEVEGRTYFEVESASLSPQSGDTDWRVTETLPLRYDTLSARVVTPTGYSITPCPFDEPAHGASTERLVFCDPETVVFRSGPASLEQETGLLVTSASFKAFGYYGIADGYSPGRYAAGVGYLTDTRGAWSHIGFEGLSYASVEQEGGSILELGSRYAVASDDAPEAGGLTLQVGPNPTTGPLTLHLDVPVGDVVTLEAFDALGRRVQEVPLAAGETRVAVNASGWASGVYVIRARTEREQVTAMVVRR